MKSVARHHEAYVLEFPLDVERRAVESHGVDPVHFERTLISAAREFLARPGKAFRARFVESAFLLAGGPKGGVPRACLEAVELLHGGSLIVDDIQDQAETRRGAPALHRLVGTPKALNVGNWLYFVALSKLHEVEVEPARSARLLQAAHVCLMRCHEGQALDLGLRVTDVKSHELADIARTTSSLKTGALMGFAARLGAVAAEATDREVSALERFGQRTGIALQMLDDLGSFAAETRREKALEDLAGERVNWVWSWARETLDEVTFRQLVRALGRPEDHPDLCLRLAAASESLGRTRVRRALDEAISELKAVFAPSAALEHVTYELARLEKSYG